MEFLQDFTKKGGRESIQTAVAPGRHPFGGEKSAGDRLDARPRRSWRKGNQNLPTGAVRGTYSIFFNSS